MILLKVSSWKQTFNINYFVFGFYLILQLIFINEIILAYRNQLNFK